MKKTLVLALVAAMGLGLFAGCGSTASNSSSSTSTSTKTEGSASTDAAWPKGTVTILCGFGAGGSSDLECRSIATYLEKVTGGTFVVSNVTGANGWMAWDQLLHSDKDGSVIAMCNTPTLFYDYMDPSQGHSETMDDFDFIANEVIDFGVLVCKKGTYANMDEFMAAAKADGGVTVGDVGANGNKHIASIQLGLANEGTTITPVHEKGWSDNYASLLGGTVDAVSAVYGDIASVLADDEITVLCVYNDARVDVLSDVPTCEELGYGAIYSAPSRGYFVAAGVDASVKEQMVKAFNEAINNADHVAELQALGLIVDYKDGDDYISFLKGQEADVEALKPELGWQ